VKELADTETFDCVARLWIEEVMVGVRLVNVGALVRLKVCEIEELE
jgi:hypothetical protein